MWDSGTATEDLHHYKSGIGLPKVNTSAAWDQQQQQQNNHAKLQVKSVARVVVYSLKEKDERPQHSQAPQSKNINSAFQPTLLTAGSSRNHCHLHQQLLTLMLLVVIM
ncbi:hypothetical protein BsWGS_03508 [Bradybaena similaris]